mmetsp:Transcript_19014/g.53637  ORF Transcript_19014/g.53637 Transcript_19014/m.53637 type:complete len:270 (+) Transcript_19014:620-1429(+)
MEEQLLDQFLGLWLGKNIHDFARGGLDLPGLVHLQRDVEHVRVHLVQHLQLLHHGEVVDVVRVQDRVDARLPDLPVLLLVEHPERGRLGLVDDLEELRAVHVLQRRVVVVPDRQLVGRLEEEGVVEARVAHVVAHGADDQRVPLVGAQERVGRAQVQEPEHAVGHVHRVVPVVVRDLRRVPVGAGDGLDEGREALLVLARVERAEVEDHHAQAHLVPLLLLDAQRVELPALEDVPVKARVLEEPLDRLHQLLGMVDLLVRRYGLRAVHT